MRFIRWAGSHLALYSAAVLVVGVIAGIVFQRLLPVGGLLRSAGVLPRAPAATPTPNLALRTEVPLSTLPTGRVMVAVVLGQSNSANFGESPRASGPGVYNFCAGRLYAARDPMLGADGIGGSVWTRLGDKLIAGRHFDAVIFVPLGIGNTAIARWTAGGDLHARLLDALDQLKGAQLAVTHLLWHQGESDAARHTSRDDYQRQFRAMLAGVRARGVQAPIYVSLATWCGKQRDDEVIREAQRGLVDPAEGILAGPDTDALGFAYRFDGCHFTDEGLDAAAEQWRQVLVR